VRLAEIAHRALGLPGMTTLRNRSTMVPIVASVGKPTTKEITKNIDSCMEPVKAVLAQMKQKVFHHVLMLDEIAVEKRIRWDHQTNGFLGVCREHGEQVNLQFNSEDDMVELFKQVDEGHVHHAMEVSWRSLTEPGSS
jgi:hypothetical protein